LVQLVVPRFRRARVTESPGQLVITVPPARSLAGVLVGVALVGIAAWLLLKVWPVVSAFVKRPSLAVGDLLLMAFALGFVLLALNATYGLMFELFGTEEARIEADRLQIRRTVAGIGHRARYRTSQVEHLRVLDLSGGPYVRGIAIGPSRNGLLAFDYDGRLVRFGDDLDAAEAVAIRDLIEARPTGMPSSPGAA
jgi:hypothetical protein